MTGGERDLTHTEADLEWFHAVVGRLTGRGIEIGAFHSPVPLPGPVEIEYVDLLPTAVQRRYFPEIPEGTPVVEPAQIAPADDLHPYADGALDFVIASHLLEHLPSPVGALAEWHRVLRPGGLVYLCLPDMRSTFDRNRTRTTLEHVLADADEPEDAPARRERDLEHYREWAREVNGLTEPGQVEFWARHLQRIRYPIHFHCWHPEDLLELVDHLRDASRVGFAVSDSAVLRRGYEFVHVLSKV